MMKAYTKPVVTIDNGMAEGVYAASGAAQGTLDVTYVGVWDRWGDNGGKAFRRKKLHHRGQCSGVPAQHRFYSNQRSQCHRCHRRCTSLLH